MYPAPEGLQYPVAQNAPQDAVTEITAGQTVAVVQVKPAAAVVHRERFGVNHQADPVGQIATEGEIVVAGQVVDFHPAAGQPFEGAQDRRRAGRHDVPVLEPEIEEIAENAEAVAVGLYPGQQLEQAGLFGGLFGGRLDAEVHVADEVEGRHGVYVTFWCGGAQDARMSAADEARATAVRAVQPEALGRRGATWRLTLPAGEGNL